MPHNLYLHSSLVQTRKFKRTAPDIRKAIKYNIFDSVIALNLAFFVNAAILILAASAFFKNGMYEVSEIQDAHNFLAPLLGSTLAPKLFAIALIAAGQSSTITGTLAGQIVMEGFLQFRLPAWLRRLITRMVAIVPAAGVTLYYGAEGTGMLLILSQVILAFQLPFAIVPLVMFTRDQAKMGPLAAPGWLTAVSAVIAAIIIALNVKLLWDVAASL